VRLVTASVEQVLAGLDKQNSAALGKLPGRGNVGQAAQNADGTMRARIRTVRLHAA
jgi:PQQ system protein